MATIAEDKLCQLLKNSLQPTSLNLGHLKVCRKTKDLAHGDFVVPKGVLDIDLKAEDIQNLNLQTSLQQETSEDVLPISSVSQDKYNSMVFHIDRKKAFSNIVQRVLSAGERYGCQPAKDTVKVIVNPGDLHCSGGDQIQHPASLVQLRAVVLVKHILQLLTANGYQAEIARFPISDNVKDLLNVLHVDVASCEVTAIEELCQRLSLQAQSSPFKETLKSQKPGDSEGPTDSVVLNVRKFMSDNDLMVGRHGYDSNLNLVNVRLEDGSVSEAVRGAAVIDAMAADHMDKETSGVCAVCVHVVSQSQAYTQQQTDLVWRMCSLHPSPSFQQRHLVFGTVGRRKSSAAATMDAKDFYNVRHRQMSQAAMMKYGDHDQGAAWDDMIAGLTAASITFDLLTTACPSQVHLDVCEDEGEGADNRSGPFILYNCARLASLLLTFQQQVQQGVYPPLPSPQDINFQLLREEEEWTLAFLYIHEFPRLVQDTVQEWNPGTGLTTHIATHKLCHFLLNFSKTLSSYYSRYHILGGSEAHLLPVMFARLTLMTAAHHVLCNGLRLLGLQPFTQL